MESFSMIRNAMRNRHYVLPSKKRVGYIGWLGYGNLGDEAMYVAFKRIFSRIDTVLFKHSHKMEMLEKIMKRRIFNAVILGGGTLINSPGSLEDVRAALDMYQPVFAFGTGAQHPEFWDRVRDDAGCMNGWIDSLRRCAFVGVRGPVSKEILEDNGFDGAQVVGDLALFLARDEVIQKRMRKKVGVNIGTSNGKVWGSEGGVLDYIVRCVRVMVDEGWDVTFIPVWKADMRYIDEARKRIGKPIEVFSQYDSIEKTMDFLESCDVFVGEKLHSVVLAMCVHTPSLMLEYRPKCRDFMVSMELGKFNMRTDALNVDVTMDLLSELYENMNLFQQKIHVKNEYYRKIQREKGDRITESILRRSSGQSLIA